MPGQASVQHQAVLLVDGADGKLRVARCPHLADRAEAERQV